MKAMPQGEIKVTCRAADLLPIDSILEFQGDLKRLTKKNKEKLKKSILKNGFTAPIFIWQKEGDNFILDGHQRLATLLSMRQDGYDIPLLPVAYIEAKDEHQAKDKLLVITSQYGDFNIDELEDWIIDIDSDIKDCLNISLLLEIEKNEKVSLSDFNNKGVSEGIVFKCPKCGFVWEK